MQKMKFVIIVILISSFGAPVFVHAGLLSFFGDVASISSAMSSGDSGQQYIPQDDLKKINKYLWAMVEKKQYSEGYEFLAEALESCNDVNYIDTAAQAYFDNGQKTKAIDLYETKVLPTGRAIGSTFESTYRRMKGLVANEKIPYSEIYKKIKNKEEDKIKASKDTPKTLPTEYVLWGILATLILNLVVNIIGHFRSNSARQAIDTKRQNTAEQNA